MRPKVPVQRAERISFRLFSLEKKAINIAARRAGLCTSSFIRKICLKHYPKPKRSENQILLYKKLIEYRNNFAKIRDLILQNKNPQPELNNIIQQIDDHIKTI